MRLRTAPFLLALALPAFTWAQIVLDNTMTPAAVVQNVLLGQGVTASNITFNGQPGNILSEQIGAFDGSACNIGMNLGVVLATGDIMNAEGPNDSGSSTTGGGNFGQSDPDLAAIGSNATINDAAVLEFDFIPTGDSLKFDFVFGSDEYLEFVNSSFNDVFGFFLSGPGINGPYSNNAINIALVPNTSQAVTIDNVNDMVNPSYYNINGDGWTAPYNNDPFYVQYDGFTVVITARAEVVCGLTYHIKIAVGDAGDTAFDSAVFLQAGSFTSTGSVIPLLTTAGNVSANDSTMFEGCGIIPFDFIRIGDTSVVDTVNIAISGTATGGVDYFPAFPTQLIYQPGDTIIPWPINVPLDADGLETLIITISQNIVCSGTQVVNEYQFYIDQYPALDVQTADVNGDCGGQYDLTPTVTGGTGLYHFNWDTGETTPSITVSPGVTTVYHFTVSDTCGVAPWTDSVVVTMPVYPPLSMEVSPTTLIDCLGTDDIAVLSVDGGNGTYSYGWTLDGVGVGNTAVINVHAANPVVSYVATVTDGCGSTLSDTVDVGTVPLDEIVIDAPDRTVICQGDTTVLQVLGVTGGNGVYSYQWTNSQAQVLSNTDALEVGVPFDAVYTITVNDQCGYEGSEQVYSLIPHPEPFVVDLTADTVLCLGNSVTLWAQVSGGSGYYTVEWVGQDWSDPQLEVAPEVNAQYRVNIYDQCGEVIGDDVNVGVEQPVAEIIATNAGQDDWVFEASTLPTFCRSYRWDLGDGTTSRERVVAHSYLDLEEHWVKLEVVTHTGCPANDSVLIRPPGQLFFPNAFTPDGDGVNEWFGPATRYIEEFEMTIFDRWGQLVYSTRDINKPWDGKVNGAAPVTGVYVYKYKASGHLFPAAEGFGHVTLLSGSDTQ